MKLQPKVIILLLNYNKWKDTVECIQSLFKCNYPNYEIIIVDNASTNKSVLMLQQQFPLIPIYITHKNLGYTGGINFGIEKAIEKKPEYILVLNPDTLVTDDFLGYLVESMKLCPSAAAACSTIYSYPETSKIWYAGGEFVPWRGLAVHHNYKPTVLAGEKYKKVTFVTGCISLIRVSMLQNIGKQDERFFLYLDDIEYSIRILSKGFDLIYVPRSIIYHKCIDWKVSKHKLYYSVRNRLLLINITLNGIAKIIAQAYFIVVIALKIVVWFFIKPSYFKIAYWGIMDYYHNAFGEKIFESKLYKNE